MRKKFFILKGLYLGLFSALVLFPCSLSAKGSEIYENKDLNFTIEYPDDWTKGPNYGPDNVLTMVSPDTTPDLNVSVTPANVNGKLKDAPEEWANVVKMFFQGSGNFKISDKKSVTLNDGTEAVKAKISWKLQDIKILTFFLAMDKRGKRIRLTSSGREQVPYEVMEKVRDSFKFIK